MSGIPVGDRYRALREGADAAAADVVAELRRRHEGLANHGQRTPPGAVTYKAHGARDCAAIGGLPESPTSLVEDAVRREVGRALDALAAP